MGVVIVPLVIKFTLTALLVTLPVNAPPVRDNTTLRVILAKRAISLIALLVMPALILVLLALRGITKTAVVLVLLVLLLTLIAPLVLTPLPVPVVKLAIL
jgi:hypothetical protein